MPAVNEYVSRAWRKAKAYTGEDISINQVWRKGARTCIDADVRSSAGGQYNVSVVIDNEGLLFTLCHCESFGDIKYQQHYACKHSMAVAAVLSQWRRDNAFTLGTHQSIDDVLNA